MSERALFPDCWKVSVVVPVFKNVGERSTAKNYCPVSLFLWSIKSLKNLQIIGLFITLRNVDFFSDFQYGLRYSLSTAYLLTVVSDKIARAFNRSRAVALEYPRILTEFVMLVLFTNLSLRELQVRDFTLFLLFSVIDSFGWFKMGRLQKNIQLMLIFSRLHSWSYTFPTTH